MLKEFIAYLEKQVENGSIYVLGAQGQTGAQITEAWIKQREHNIKKNYDRAIAFWKKQISKGYTALRAFDCSGLGMYWLYSQMKLYSGDLTAQGMYGKCEPICANQLMIGDWVFRKNKLGRVHHIGYITDRINGVLYVIECKGRDDGVVKRSINASGKTYWNCYGRPKIFKAEIEEDEEMITGNSPKEIVSSYQKLLYDTEFRGNMLSTSFGSWGPRTEASTKALQAAYGLPQTGLADTKTILALGEAHKKFATQELQSKINAAKAILG